MNGSRTIGSTAGTLRVNTSRKCVCIGSVPYIDRFVDVTVCGNKSTNHPDGTEDGGRSSVFVSLFQRLACMWRYSDRCQCSRRCKNRWPSSGVPATSWCVREVLNIRSSMMREFAVTVSCKFLHLQAPWWQLQRPCVCQQPHPILRFAQSSPCDEHCCDGTRYSHQL